MEFVQTFKNDNEKDFLINDPIYKHLLIFNTFYIKLFVLFSVPFCKFLILLSVFSDWLVLFLWLVVGITATHKHRHGSNLMYMYWSVCVCMCVYRVYKSCASGTLSSSSRRAATRFCRHPILVRCLIYMYACVCVCVCACVGVCVCVCRQL